MKLNPLIYDQINIKGTRLRLALALGVTEQSIRNAIKYRRTLLTQFVAIQIIKKELRLNDSDIFIAEVEEINEINNSVAVNSENKPTRAPFQEPAFYSKKLSKQEKEQIKFKIKNDRLKKIK